MSSFPEWYRIRLGHRPLLIQAALWLLYGFVWIPVWYLTTGSSGPFSAWYRTRLGHQLPVAQIAMWVLYGFIWIPAWYFATRRTPFIAVDGPSTGGWASPSEGSEGPVVTTNEPRPDAVWPVVSAGDRLRALFAVRPVAAEITQHADTTDSARLPVRILRWNYTRLFALGWAALSLAISVRSAPRPGGPSTVDLFFGMIGLLYVVFVALQVAGGSYCRSFFVEDQYSGLPARKARLLATCAMGGLLQVLVAAALVGVAMAVGTALQR